MTALGYSGAASGSPSSTRGRSLDGFVASTSGHTNPCSEGEFLDLAQDVCRPLVKGFGFDASMLLREASTTQYNLSVCSAAELENVLEGLPATGGVVNLPACTLVLSGSLSLPGNVVLQGAGRDRTTIKAGPSMVGKNMVRAKRARNVVVRDLTVDGSGFSSHGILIWYSANALVERVRVVDTNESGVSFRYAKQVTIRYIESSGHTDNHGIVSKDCTPKNALVPDLEECAARAGSAAPGELWTRDYAIYSNHLHHNAGHGLDSHASDGEIAGNSIHDNRYGTKFPDTRRLWIHHNEIFDNRDWGLHIYSAVQIPERVSKQSVIYANFFGDNADYPVRVARPSREIYLLGNSYSANSPNELRIDRSEVFVCQGTEDAHLKVAGGKRKEATERQCDLSRVATLWDGERASPDCYRLTLTHSGEGADPVASPPSSSACAAGSFVAGERVELTAAPRAGWDVTGWSGTDADGSTSTKNALTMPARSHSASVSYVQEPYVPNRLVPTRRIESLLLESSQCQSGGLLGRLLPRIDPHHSRSPSGLEL